VRPFFPDPQLPDPTWGTCDESPTEWISRSTLPRARAVRDFLNHNLEALPLQHQKAFAKNLRSRWSSALFELVVARLLQGLGIDLEIEVLNHDQRRPDFSFALGGSRFTIEAVAPQFDRETTATRKRDRELIDLVERNAPAAWSILLRELPDIGPSESKAPLKDAVRRLAKESSPAEAGERRDFRFRLPQGFFSGSLFAGRHGHTAVVGGPTYVGWDDSKERISRALSRKKCQVRSETVPVFLAVLASGISSGFDDFDELLLGNRVSHLGFDSKETHVTFDESPKFVGRPLSGTYGGILAFTALSPFGVRGPILYVHPELPDLPSEFGAFERRCLSKGEIIRVPPSRQSPATVLRFAESNSPAFR
jgi:hypothetical protein